MQKLLHCLPVAESVINTLNALGRTMTYAEFGRAIGLISGAWNVQQKTEVENLLNLLGMLDRDGRFGDGTLNFAVIVNAETGKPGEGFERNRWRIAKGMRAAEEWQQLLKRLGLTEQEKAFWQQRLALFLKD
jgi:hypothetical protein